MTGFALVATAGETLMSSMKKTMSGTPSSRAMRNSSMFWKLVLAMVTVVSTKIAENTLCVAPGTGRPAT